MLSMPTPHDPTPSDDGGTDFGPQSISKGALLAELQTAGLQSQWTLRDALEQCSGLAGLRAQLRAQVGDRPCIGECEGRSLDGLLPAALHHWPVWYVRLPDGWYQDVPRLVEATRFQNHILRDELEPWRVPQWLSIISQYSDKGWPADARRLDVDDGDACWMLARAKHTDAVLMLFECAGTVTATAYPVDEELMWDLQAGDACSSRRPLFDIALADLQAMTRAAEEGHPHARPGESLRLSVVPVDRSEATTSTSDYQALLRPYFRTIEHDAGLIGEPCNVMDWCPADLHLGAGSVLRLYVPPELHWEMLEWGVRCRVVRNCPRGGAPMLLALTIRCGQSLYIATMRMDDSRMYRAVRQFVDRAVCRVLAVNIRNGQPYVIRVAWPRHLNGLYAAGVAGLHGDINDVLVSSEDEFVQHIRATTPGVEYLHLCGVRLATSN